MINTSLPGYNKANVFSGGVGSYTTNSDGLTVLGNGSAGDVLRSSSAQPIYYYNTPNELVSIIGNGIYVFNASGITAEFSLNLINGSRLVFVVSNNAEKVGFSYNPGNLSIFYQGVNYGVEEISSGLVVEMVYHDNILYIINPAYDLGYLIQINGGGGDYDILTSGFYEFYASGGSGNNKISFPQPIHFDGQKVTIYNSTANKIDINTNKPHTPSNANVNDIPAESVATFIADREQNNWFQIGAV